MIVAADPDEVIGRDGRLPWHFTEDMQRYRKITTGHAMVAGRATHESIVERLGRALPGRITLVASRTRSGAGEGYIYVPTVDDAIAAARTIEEFAGGDEIFVIGGVEVYLTTLPLVDRIQLTRIHERHDGDTRLPSGWLDGFRVVEEDPRDGFTFLTYERE
jgi:dihydrofolate reductase